MLLAMVMGGVPDEEVAALAAAKSGHSGFDGKRLSDETQRGLPALLEAHWRVPG